MARGLLDVAARCDPGRAHYGRSGEVAEYVFQFNCTSEGELSKIRCDSIFEIVDLDGVCMLQLVIDPDIARGPVVASLASWRLADRP